MLKPPNRTVKNLLQIKEIIDNQSNPEQGCWPGSYNGSLSLCLEGALMQTLSIPYSTDLTMRDSLTEAPEYHYLMRAGEEYYPPYKRIQQTNPGFDVKLFHYNDKCSNKAQVQWIAARAVELAFQEVE